MHIALKHNNQVTDEDAKNSLKIFSSGFCQLKTEDSVTCDIPWHTFATKNIEVIRFFPVEKLR